MPSVKEILDTMDYGPTPESNTHVADWLKAHDKGFGHFIGGDFVSSSGGQQFDVSNPANGKKMARVAQGTTDDIDAAVKAARKAA